MDYKAVIKEFFYLKCQEINYFFNVLSKSKFWIEPIKVSIFAIATAILLLVIFIIITFTPGLLITWLFGNLFNITITPAKDSHEWFMNYTLLHSFMFYIILIPLLLLGKWVRSNWIDAKRNVRLGIHKK